MSAATRLNLAFFALSDPTRRELLRLLAPGPATVSSLAARFRQSLPGVSKHLRILAEAGFVSLRRSATDRRARVCRLRAGGLTEVHRWIAMNRAAWHRRFDAMEGLLAAAAKRNRA